MLALGGVVGPVVFVCAWALAGATTSGYSPVDDAISDLAAVDAPTRVPVTVSFVLFGFGLFAFGLALREALDGRAWIAAVATGVCTIGVAATPLHGWSDDDLHAVFASLGYAAIVAIPLLAAPALAGTGRRLAAGASVLAAALSAICLAASTVGVAHGLWQRLGRTMADAWIVVMASWLIAGGARARASDAP
jgi:hypothetical membrane protein